MEITNWNEVSCYAGNKMFMLFGYICDRLNNIALENDNGTVLSTLIPAVVLLNLYY